MWPSYQKRWSEAASKGEMNVSRPRAFFVQMRVAAMSGRFYVLGAAPLEDAAVIAEFRDALLTWYDVPGTIGAKQLSAFDAFTARAKNYNAGHRAPSNMRKHIRDALIKASTMESFRIASYFDSLLIDKTALEMADFQNNGGQRRILDAFKQALRATLAEEPEAVSGRIRAAIVLGSFATGSAGPNSDFDVELLIDGGSNARSPAFIKRLTDRWIATGRHARNPVTVHDFPSTPSRGIIDLIHTGDYIVVSLDDNLTRELQRKPGEYAPKMIRRDSLRGRVNRAVQYGVILGSSYVGDWKRRFGAGSGSGH
jgi:predicted nucleotidyltransferase